MARLRLGEAPGVETVAPGSGDRTDPGGPVDGADADAGPQSAIPCRAPQGSREFTNMPTQCLTTTAVSLLGTLISMAKRE